MKKARIEKMFLEELERASNISLACQKVNLSRQTIYRWMKEDQKFGQKVDNALAMGVDSLCDLAESKLVTNIKSGNQRAIEYYLTNNKKKYHRPKKPLDTVNIYQPVKTIVIQPYDPEKHKPIDKVEDI